MKAQTQSENLRSALNAWTEEMGSARVVLQSKDMKKYEQNTLGISRHVPVCLKPADVPQLIQIVKIAQTWKIPVYPISTGKNWGYGCASPVEEGCAIIDLSGMNQILKFDEELGLVTLQPGVTQQQLQNYLNEHHIPYMVPTTGAGPSASLLGNALERGYGLTPHADHFGAVTSIEAVLPNGQIYRSALSELGGAEVDQVFKWGLGPYLDGIFSQGNFGIVTQATIALARRPSHIQGVIFTVKNDRDLEAAVLRLRKLAQTLGSNISNFNLIQGARIQAISPYAPKAAWIGIGAIYGEKPLVKASRKIIVETIRPCASRIFFFDKALILRIIKTIAFLSPIARRRLKSLAESLEQMLAVLSGIPTEAALPSVYANPQAAGTEKNLNPSKDGCGLFWYSPLIPMKPDAVRRCVSMVQETCAQFGIPCMITLTAISDKCFDSTLPILFDRADEAARKNAAACYEALFDAGKKLGFVPYRVGIQSMSKVVDETKPFWQVVRAFKEALDPNHILAPGRYAPRPMKPG